MNALVSALAFLTGLTTGVVFAYLQIPIPAPPKLPGILGIVGIYVGYKVIQWAGIGFDVLDALGL